MPQITTPSFSPQISVFVAKETFELLLSNGCYCYCKLSIFIHVHIHNGDALNDSKIHGGQKGVLTESDVLFEFL